MVVLAEKVRRMFIQ